MIKAVIFDMDGLLLDSEPFWKEAEINVFGSVGAPLTPEMCDSTVGKRIEEVVTYWHKIYPWDTARPGFALEDIKNRVIRNVIGLINEKGTPFEGVGYIIKFFKERNIKTAIASSSATSIIDAVLEKFEIRNEFDVIHSAELEKYGKPDPAVYINTAKLLGIEQQNCLAFEDSYNGMLASKNAAMKTVVIPEARYFDDERFEIADIKLKSLMDFNEEILGKLEA